MGIVDFLQLIVAFYYLSFAAMHLLGCDQGLLPWKNRLRLLSKDTRLENQLLDFTVRMVSQN